MQRSGLYSDPERKLVGITFEVTHLLLCFTVDMNVLILVPSNGKMVISMLTELCFLCIVF